jgi:hypothetical protein
MRVVGSGFSKLLPQRFLDLHMPNPLEKKQFEEKEVLEVPTGSYLAKLVI